MRTGETHLSPPLPAARRRSPQPRVHSPVSRRRLRIFCSSMASKGCPQSAVVRVLTSQITYPSGARQIRSSSPRAGSPRSACAPAGGRQLRSSTSHPRPIITAAAICSPHRPVCARSSMSAPAFPSAPIVGAARQARTGNRGFEAAKVDGKPGSRPRPPVRETGPPSSPGTGARTGRPVEGFGGAGATRGGARKGRRRCEAERRVASARTWKGGPDVGSGGQPRAARAASRASEAAPSFQLSRCCGVGPRAAMARRWAAAP